MKDSDGDLNSGLDQIHFLRADINNLALNLTANPESVFRPLRDMQPQPEYSNASQRSATPTKTRAEMCQIQVSVHLYTGRTKI